MVRNKTYHSPASPMLLLPTRGVNPIRPETFVPKLTEIVHALPHINRYNGHTPFPYSVAHHSVLCMVVAEADYGIVEHHKLLYLLLHDAPEAYVQDIIRPLKRYVSDELIEIEKRIMRKLIRSIPFTDEMLAELDDIDFLAVVDEIDTRMAVTEIELLLPAHKDPIPGFDSFDIQIHPKSVEEIRSAYRSLIVGRLALILSGTPSHPFEEPPSPFDKVMSLFEPGPWGD